MKLYRYIPYHKIMEWPQYYVPRRRGDVPPRRHGSDGMIRVAWPCVIAAWGMLGGYTIVVFLSLPFWMTLVLAAGIAWKLCGCDS